MTHAFEPLGIYPHRSYLCSGKVTESIANQRAFTAQLWAYMNFVDMDQELLGVVAAASSAKANQELIEK
jgi:hypothetical protein